MNDLIEEFMEPMFSAEAYELYKDIILFLEAGPNESVQEDIVALILSPLETSLRDEQTDDDNDIDVKADGSTKPEDIIRDQLVSYLQTALISGLRDFGVEVTDGTTIRNLFLLLVGLYQIDKYEDAATLVQIVSIDTDNIERLSQVLEIITSESPTLFEEILDSVSDDLIRGIQKLSIDRIDDAYRDMEESDIRNFMMRIRAYREYMQSIGFENLVIYEYISSIVMGSDFETYLNSGFLNEVIMNNNMEKLANEMYGLALVSAQSTDPLGAIRDVAEKFVGDNLRVAQLNNEAIRINGGYSKFLQEAMNRDKAGGII